MANPLVGASTGSGTPSQVATTLRTKIQRFYEPDGLIPANWARTSGSTAAVGNVVAHSVKPDIGILKLGSGRSYTSLVSRLKAMHDGRPDRAGERQAMWHEAYGRSFAAADWARASINYYNDVMAPVNAGRRHAIKYYINLQGHTIASRRWQSFFTAAVMRACDEVTFDAYQTTVQDTGSAIARAAGKPFGIPEYGFLTGVHHTDAQIAQYMRNNVPRLNSLTNLAWICWFNGGTNSIVPAYTASCTYWRNYSTSIP